MEFRWQTDFKDKIERCSCAIKRPVVIWIFHTFPCIFSRKGLRFSGSRGKTNTDKCMDKIQNATGYFLAQLHSSICSWKILCLVPKVSNSWIFQKWSFMKIIWHWISLQTLYFKTCLPVRQDGFQNCDKVRWYTLDLQSQAQRTCALQKGQFCPNYKNRC